MSCLLVGIVYADTLLDNCVISNNTNYQFQTSEKDAAGQTFATPASPTYKITQVQFVITKTNTPTGYMHVILYSTNGTYGTTSAPENVLATSDSIDVSTFPSEGSAFVLFNFTGAQQITLNASSFYAVSCEKESGSWSGGNFLNLAAYDSAPTTPNAAHSGNAFNRNWGAGVFSAEATYDCRFKVYGIEVEAGVWGEVETWDLEFSCLGMWHIVETWLFTFQGAWRLVEMWMFAFPMAANYSFYVYMGSYIGLIASFILTPVCLAAGIKRKKAMLLLVALLLACIGFVSALIIIGGF